MLEREVFVFIDNFYSFNDAISEREFPEGQPFEVKNFSKMLATIARRGNRLHFIVSGMGQDIDTGNTLAKYMMSTRYGIATDRDSLNGKPFYGDANKFKNMETNKGRGFVVEPGSTQVIQFAQPYDDEINIRQELDAKIAQIQETWSDKQKATWSIELPAYQPADGTGFGIQRNNSATTDYNTMAPQQLQEGVRDCIIRKFKAHLGVETSEELINYGVTDAIDDVSLKEMAEGMAIDISECLPADETDVKQDEEKTT
jgi:hypothetical protein